MQGTPKIIRVRISLANIESEVWRIVDVPADMSLSFFHVVIQLSMGWRNEHCHEFRTESCCYVDLREMDGQEGDATDERRVTIAQLNANPRTRAFVYRYDFGDCWDHLITLESMFDYDGSTFAPRCIAGAGACPLENCGGSPGYHRCRVAFDLRGHRWSGGTTGMQIDPETEGLLRSIGKWDPLRFELPAVNRKLKGRFAKYRSALGMDAVRVQ